MILFPAIDLKDGQCVRLVRGEMAAATVFNDDPAAQANREAWTALTAWKKPLLTAFSDRDPVTAGFDRVLRGAVPGAAGQRHTVIEGAGHFLQEDAGEELARVVVDFVTA